MANDNNTPQFTATDIEKYHRGLLSNKERHALEKAAMDDPFLADALDGYAVAGVNANADMLDLSKRLAQRTGGAKVIPMHQVPAKNNFSILRAAVVIAFIAGAGLLTYQFAFNKNKKEESIAQVPVVKNKVATDTNGANTVVTTTQPNTVTSPVGSDQTPVTILPERARSTENKTSKEEAVSRNDQSLKSQLELQKGDVAVNSPSKPASPVLNETKPSAGTIENKSRDVNDDKFSAGIQADEAIDRAKRKDAGLAKKITANTQNNAAYSISAEQNTNLRRSQPITVFRGVVTDHDNNPVPFANVTNLQDNNAGTYTDARGYFNLTSPDSILNVQVRSVGYENMNVQLRGSVANNQVRLQDDKIADNVTLQSARYDTAALRVRTSNVKLEQPEPADGWQNYNAYVANNVTLPEDLKEKKMISGEVQVSFEVDKDGEPTNIKIVKSLCDKCDKEAIRLIKEGPKWKRKARKGRTTVTINF